MIRRIFLSLLFVSSVSSVTSVAQAQTEPKVGGLEELCIATASTIDTKIRCLKGVTITESVPWGQSGRLIRLKIQQPVDHQKPELGTFDQSLALLHRSENEPMVLQTSGYQIFNVAQAAITMTFGTNQLQVEHRFFASSKPASNDWSKLDIKQSADDFHRIVVAFKKIYKRPWVNTGASKGGMTSVYHRRFYPDDLAGTVADVAPLSFSTEDQRYVDFINTVGGEKYASCRENFKALQRTLLENRDTLLESIEGNFTQLGGKEVAFEHSVIELSFAFWQYGNPESSSLGCNSVPVNSSPEAAFLFAQRVLSTGDFSDESINSFMPYYFQAATQLGCPASDLSHLNDLRKHPYSIDQYTPRNVQYTYSNEMMRDVESWVRNEAKGIIFVYGQFDPWSAGEFPKSDKEPSVHKFWVPGGNHGANFTKLPSDKRSEAIEILSSWLGKRPVFTDATQEFASRKTLEDFEFEARKKLGVRF